MRTLIRGAELVLVDRLEKMDLVIEGGKIAQIDPASSLPVDETIEARGMLLFPGVIDDQVHFREPGLTHKEDLTTASRACAAGGITAYLEMPNTKPAAITCDLVDAKYRRAAEVSAVHYGFYIGATCNNIDELCRASRYPGIKIFIGSSTGDLLVDEQEALERIFALARLPICAHCEDESTVRANQAALGSDLTVADHSRIRDHRAAIIATRRAIDLAIRHRHRFHVLHVSTGDEVPLFAPARPWITAEACPHHLFFSIDDYQRLGTLVQMNPSLKTKQDAKAIWQGLIDGDIQVIATDHAPHTLEEKAQPYPASPSGLPAVENVLALILNQAAQGKCSYPQIASWMCDAPARIWGLVGKGRIAEGYDADLVLVDPRKEKTIRNEEQWAKCKWSPWAGETLTGWAIRTWVGGKTVYYDGVVDESVRGSELLCDHARGGFWATSDGIGVR